ncbi:MAG: hypothetical protein V4739_10760 [Pseudomonadota bacterium]
MALSLWPVVATAATTAAPIEPAPHRMAAAPASAQLFACQALAVSRGLHQSAQDAVWMGDSAAFQSLRARREELTRLAAASASTAASSALASTWVRLDQQAALVLAQAEAVQRTHEALRTVQRESIELLGASETLMAVLMRENAPVANIMVSSQMTMLTQRIALSSAEFFSREGVSPEAVFLLGKDLNSFDALLAALRDGSTELRVTKASTPAVREQVAKLAAQYPPIRAAVQLPLKQLQGLVSARQAQAGIEAEGRRVEQALGTDCLGTRGV